MIDCDKSRDDTWKMMRMTGEGEEAAALVVRSIDVYGGYHDGSCCCCCCYSMVV